VRKAWVPTARHSVTSKSLRTAFWINRNYREDRYSVDWLLDQSESQNIVVLVHPEDILRGTPLVAKEYEQIVSNATIAPVNDVIHDVLKGKQ